MPFNSFRFFITKFLSVLLAISNFKGRILSVSGFPSRKKFYGLACTVIASKNFPIIIPSLFFTSSASSPVSDTPKIIRFLDLINLSFSSSNCSFFTSFKIDLNSLAPFRLLSLSICDTLTDLAYDLFPSMTSLSF